MYEQYFASSNDGRTAWCRDYTQHTFMRTTGNELYVEVQNVGFSFGVDAKRKCNYVHPAFLSFFNIADTLCLKKASDEIVSNNLTPLFHVNHIEPLAKLASHLFEERHTLEAKFGVDGDTCPSASVISLQFGLQFIWRTIGKHVYSRGGLGEEVFDDLFAERQTGIEFLARHVLQDGFPHLRCHQAMRQVAL